MIALDTSFLVDYLRGVDATETFLKKQDAPVYYVPSISLFELHRDAAWADTKTVEAVADAIGWVETLPFCEDGVKQAAEIHAELLTRGTPINAADVMIAGVCRHHGAALVTRDRDFDAVSGLETLTY